MAINDPYDRSGQYAGGDTGPKVGGFGATAPDQRDYAVGAMMGEGGRDNAQGYAGILDSIQNRMDAINQGANYGTKGNATHQDVVTARKGAEYNAFSPRERNAFGTANRGIAGNPRPGREAEWHSQAMDVYDDYYSNPQSSYRGIAQGGTFYQNEAKGVVGKEAGRYQRDMQQEFGAVPIGNQGHVMTGPGLVPDKSAWDALERNANTYAPTDQPVGRQNVPDAIKGGWGDDELGAAYDGWDDLGHDVIDGGYGDDFLAGDPISDDMLDDQPQAITGNVGQNQIGRPMRDAIAQPQAARPQGGGISATTTQNADGTVNYGSPGEGGGQAFGPSDPFGGLGYGNVAGERTDVVDTVSADVGQGDYDSGWRDGGFDYSTDGYAQTGGGAAGGGMTDHGSQGGFDGGIAGSGGFW